MRWQLLTVALCLVVGISNAALLGDNCADLAECVNGVPESECDIISSKCKCKKGYVQDANKNDQCFAEVTDVGASCSIEEQCTFEFATCAGEEGNFKCTCQEGYVHDPDKKDQCFAVVGGLEESCLIEEQCSMQFTTCAGEEGDFKCMCAESYVKNAAKNGCVKRASLLEQSCEVQEQCMGIIDARCSLQLGECRCITSHVPNIDLSMCLPRKPNLGDTCNIGTQCSVDGSHCIDQECICSSSHITYEARCLPLIESIQIARCEVSEQCPTDSQCLMNGVGRKCMCNNDFIKNDAWKGCVPKRYTIGGICEQADQCMVEDSVCELEGKIKLCNCKSGSVSSSDYKKCIEASETLGETCEIDNQCLVPNSRCNGSICECKANFVPQGTTGCQKRQGIESGVCVISSQCPENAQCLSDGTQLLCKCSTGYVKNAAGTACLPVRLKIGGVCEEAIQCSVEKAECILSDFSLKLCLCPPDHVTNDAFSVCGKMATNIGAACSIQEQCEVINGWCMGAFGMSTCICKPNSEANTAKDYCLPNVLNGPCQESSDCSQWKNSVCKGKSAQRTCKCDNGYIENNAVDQCLKATIELGSACDEKKQCLAVNSDCLGEPEATSCQCTSDYVQVPETNTCFKKAEKLREPCTSIVQCQHLSGAATCNSFHKECRCTSLNVESEDLSTCLKKVNLLGGTCNETAQCNTPSSECKIVGSEKVCACKNGTVTFGNVCLPVADEIGDACRDGVQCEWDNSECSGQDGGKTCSCKSDYVSSISKKKCLRRATIVGGVCEELAQCVSNIPNTKCERGVCKCNNSYEPSGENTKCLKISGKEQNIFYICSPTEETKVVLAAF